jgi:hypothetical protein
LHVHDVKILLRNNSVIGFVRNGSRAQWLNGSMAQGLNGSMAKRHGREETGDIKTFTEEIQRTTEGHRVRVRISVKFL